MKIKLVSTLIIVVLMASIISIRIPNKHSIYITTSKLKTLPSTNYGDVLNFSSNAAVLDKTSLNLTNRSSNGGNIRSTVGTNFFSIE